MISKKRSAKNIRSAITSFDIEKSADTNLEITRTLGNITAKLEKGENRENKQLTELIEELQNLPREARSQRIHEEKMFRSLVKLIAGYEDRAKDEPDKDKKESLISAAGDLRKEAEKLVRTNESARPANVKEAFAEKYLKISPQKMREADGSIRKAYGNEWDRIKRFVGGKSGDRGPKAAVDKAVETSKKSDEVIKRFKTEIGPAIRDTQADAGLDVDKSTSIGKADQADLEINKGRGTQTVDTDQGLVGVDESGNVKPTKRSKKGAKGAVPVAPPVAPKALVVPVAPVAPVKGTATPASSDGSPILNKIYDEVRAIRNAVAQPRDDKTKRFKMRDGEETKPRKPRTRKNKTPAATASPASPPSPPSPALEAGSLPKEPVKVRSVEGSITTVEIGKKSIAGLAEAIGDIIGRSRSGGIIPIIPPKAANFMRKALPFAKKAGLIGAGLMVSKGVQEAASKAINEAKENGTLGRIHIEDRARREAAAIEKKSSIPQPPKIETPLINTGTTLEKSSTQPPPAPVVNQITNNTVNNPPQAAPKRNNNTGGVRSLDNSHIRYEDKNISPTLNRR